MANIYDNPVNPPSPSIDDYYAQSKQRVQAIRAGLREQQFAPEEEQPRERRAKVAIDASTNRLFIGGYVVDRNDDTSVALLSKYADRDAPLPEGNWEEVDPASFSSYVQGIRDPGLIKLMGRNFSMGVDEMQQMAGLGLQWLGAESAGQYLADQEGDLAPNQVYSRSFTDIGSSPENGILDWMAATIGRLGPNVVESTISAGIGAAVGGAVSGPAVPAAAPIGALAGFFGKTAVKKALLEAAKKQLKGEALDAAEKKLLLSAAGLTNAAANAAKTRLMSPGAVAGFVAEGVQQGAEIVGGQVARRAAQAGGAAGLSMASNVFQQTGQAYGETMAGGGEGDRMSALGAGILGGVVDTIPEFILASRLFSEAAGDVVGAAKKQKSAMDLLKGVAQGRTGKVITGASGGAVLEGGAEAFQELLQIAANPTVDWSSPEGANRIVNSFAAGALMGSGFGAVGNAFAGSLSDNKTEANLLLPVSQSDPAFTQYREDLKAQLGEKATNALYPPMAPQVLGAYPKRGEFDAAQAERQDAASGMAGLRPYAGTQVPLGVGLSGSVPAPVSAPDIPVANGSETTIPGMSGAVQGSLPQGIEPTVYAGQPLPTAPVMSMGAQIAPPQPVGPLPSGPGVPVGPTPQGVQQPPVTPAVPPVQDLRSVGIPQPAPAAGPPLPGGQGIAARLLQRGQTLRATPPATQQGTIRQTVEQGPLRMGGQATAQMAATVTGRVTDTSLPSFSTARLKRGALPKAAYQDGLAFLTETVKDGKTSFTIEELGAFMFPKAKKLTAEQRNQAETVLSRLMENGLINERPTGVYNVAGAVPTAERGAGTAGAGNAGPVSGNGKVGEPAPGGPASSGKASKGDRLRADKKTATAEPAPQGKTEGPAARADTVQEAPDRPAVVTPAPAAKQAAPAEVQTKRRKLTKPETTVKAESLKKGKGPERPKGSGGAATPSQKPTRTEAEVEADIRKQSAEKAAKVAAAEREAARKREEQDAADRAAEVAKSEDMRGVEEAILGENTSEGSMRSRYIADLILMANDPDISPEARAKAKDHLDNEVDDKSHEYLEAVARSKGKSVDNLRPNADLDTQIVTETITGFNAGRPLGQMQVAKAREAWARLRKKGLDPDYQGAKLSSYINTKPEFFNYDLTSEGRKIVSKTLDAESKKGRNMLSQFNSVENAVDEDGRPLKPIDKLKFKSIVDTFRRGLARAPQIYVYRNQADLKAKNPGLYQQAVAARPQGDFDSAPAAGYSFGEDKVIIFSDRIATPKMLRLVLAHEAIGHFGLRALLPAKQFDALMEYVYDNSPLARQIADAESSFSGMDRLEAVEEYLARYASYLDTSIVARIVNTIKNVLNKLGITFEDDIARYLVNHARRYTREGANFFQPDRLALDISRVERDMLGSGRYNIPTIIPWQRELAFKVDMANAMPASLEEVREFLKDKSVNTSQGFDTFVRKVFRLGNYDSLRNHGAAAYEVLVNAVRTNVAALRNKYNDEFADIMGLSQDSRDALSYALYIGRSVAHQRLKLTKETRDLQLVKLYTDPESGESSIIANDEVLDKFIQMGTVSKKELDEGTTIKVQEATSIPGKFKEVEVKVDGVNKLLGRDLTDAEYDYYMKARRRMANIEVELLRARYDNYLATEKVSIAGVRKILSDNKMTEGDMVFVKNIVNHSKSIISQSIEYDAQGLPTATSKGLDAANQYLAKVNEAIIKNEEKFDAKLEEEIKGFYKNKAQGDAAIEAIKKFRERRRALAKELDADVVFALQNRLKEIVLADQMFEKAQAQARRTIAQGYVPVFREGGWQVRVEAQVDGKPAALHPEYQNKLILSLVNDRASAERGALELNKEMGDTEIEALVRLDNGTYETQKVKLFARASKTVDDVAADPSLDIDNFIHGMRMFGLATNPQAIEKIITSLTNPGSSLRKALRFDDTPGYDMKSAVTAMSRHIVTRASLIAKTRYQPAMRDLLDKTSERGKLWYGDAASVMRAKEMFDAASSDAQRNYWRSELITNLYKYRMTNPGAKDWDGSRDTFPGQPTSAELGNQFYNEAIAKQMWMEDSPNIAESTFEGKRYPAAIKAITSIAFLGGSLAQFAQNLISPITNVIPYLASKNGRTGFGGGFGVAAATMEYNRAFRDVVGLRGLKPFSRVQDETGQYSYRIGDPSNDANYYLNIATEIDVARKAKDAAEEARLVAKHRLTYYEALNIAREIREGKLIPAQSNAILETSRGLYTGGKVGRAWMKFVDIYMVPFNVSEQAARRAAFLAAFRLEFNRLRQAGLDEAVANEQARSFAVDAVDLTLGEYSNTNRPPVWREGWQSMLYMYKTYPTTAVLLFTNLSRNGKLGMLLGLMMLTGLSGFPFAEDVEDIIDTLAQRFGFPTGPSLRKQLSETLDEIAPGLAPYIIKGVANQFLPMDVASKTGIGNIIPGTGFLLSGSDPAHELAEVGGPLVGMTVNTARFTYDMIRAPLSERTTILDAMRNSPVSLMRSVGDVAVYLQNGAVVDKRGYVVSPEVNAGTVLTRLLGFYPVEAANQYEFIKYARRAADYQRSISVGYRDAWIKAMMSGDTAQADRIVQEVNEWNEANPKARFNNWMKNTLRAYKEARRPAAERFLKTTPKAARESIARYMDAVLE